MAWGWVWLGDGYRVMAGRVSLNFNPHLAMAWSVFKESQECDRADPWRYKTLGLWHQGLISVPTIGDWFHITKTAISVGDEISPIVE